MPDEVLEECWASILKSEQRRNREVIAVTLLSQLFAQQLCMTTGTTPGVSAIEYGFMVTTIDPVVQAVKYGQRNILRLLLIILPQGERFKSITDISGVNALHTSIWKVDPVSLLILLNSVSPPQQVEAIKYQDYLGNNAIMQALRQGDCAHDNGDKRGMSQLNILRILVQRLPTYERINAIICRNEWSKSALCIAIDQGKRESLRVLLEGLNLENQYHVINCHNMCPLECAIRGGNHNIISLLLDKLSSEQLLHVLKTGKEEARYE